MLNFSETDANRLGILNQGNPAVRNWKDSWNLGVGVDRALGESFHARAGIFYYPTVIPETTWDPSNAESSRIGYTFGGSYSRGSLTFDLAYNFIQFNQKNIHNTVGVSSLSTVNGTYKTSANIISVGVSLRVGGRNERGGSGRKSS
jgi:long-subunit fatty acid transport protein